MPNPIVSEDGTQQPVAQTPEFTFADEHEFYARAAWERANPYQTPGEDELPAYNYTNDYDSSWTDCEF